MMGNSHYSKLLVFTEFQKIPKFNFLIDKHGKGKYALGPGFISHLNIQSFFE